jgi:ParB family chromosome partitioning protein
MKVHPVTQCWPMMAEDDYAEFVDDIRMKGLQHPLVLLGDVLLDGRNRLKACEELGIEPQYVQYEGDDPVGYIISSNRRRNLTTGQRAMVAEKLAGLKDGQRADRQGTQKCAATLTQEQAATTMDVSRRSVQLAREVRQAAPNLAEKVASGEMTLGSAYEVAKPHVANNSGDNEWYTPKPYIESARAVMGTITLDPASTDTANRVVKAETFYTHEQDGLKQQWSGSIWLNPPFSTSLIGKFCEKLAASVESGNVAEALVLVNNATETHWFVRLCSVATGLCFPTGRVKFWHPQKESTPLQGQAVIYIGKNLEMFVTEFKKYGVIAMLPHGVAKAMLPQGVAK